ncbi:MAG TPA: MBL fold metallo-hydrolase [Chitinophagaceae bacterium]|nr:MBL fold metallo-hydrolase [Chitinophagaceae bacterium]
MKITLRGVRGSIPTTSPATKEYGGDTSCVEVEADGCLLVLDAGSGIQNLNLAGKIKNNRVDILLTHLHMDHIQGLGFFKPLFSVDTEVHIWGPASATQSLRVRLGRYFSPPLFPVYFRNLSCKLVLHEIEKSSFSIGPFTIQSCFVTHPGPTVGFRIREGEKVFTYIPDHEPALGRNGMLKDLRWLSGSDLALEADLLLHDAQYTMEEYRDRMGWGHSAMEDTLQFASLTRVKQLLLTHHDPMHSDAQLHTIYDELKEKFPTAFPFEMAVEGEEFEL